VDEILPPTAHAAVDPTPREASHQPENAAPVTRRGVRKRRRRRTGPLAAGFVIVAAAATGSVAALMTRPATPTVTTFPSVPPPPPELLSSGVPATDDESGTAGSADGAGPSLSAAHRALTRTAPSASSGNHARTAAAATAGPGAAGRIADVPDRPTVNALWPVFIYTLQAAPGTGEPPAFPHAVPGFSLIRSVTSVVSVRENRFFAAVGSLPVRTAGYARCREQRFYVRWMAVDPRAAVEATFVDEHVRTVQNRPVRGAAGWMSSYGCVQPALRIRPPAGSAPDHATVIVETRVWQRS